MMSSLSNNRRQWLIAAVAGVVLSLIVRATVYTDDCNLLVMGVTFLILTLAVWVVIKVVDKIF